MYRPGPVGNSRPWLVDHRETEAECGRQAGQERPPGSRVDLHPPSASGPKPSLRDHVPQPLMLHRVRNPPSGSGHISLKPRARLRWRYPALPGLSHLLSGHPLGPPAPGRSLHPMAHPTSPRQGVLGSQLTNSSTKGARHSALAWLPLADTTPYLAAGLPGPHPGSLSLQRAAFHTSCLHMCRPCLEGWPSSPSRLSRGAGRRQDTSSAPGHGSPSHRPRDCVCIFSLLPRL